MIEVRAKPSSPIWGFDATYQPRFAFHSFDIVAGFGHWDLWSSQHGKPAFNPEPEDEAFGDSVRALIRALASDATLDGLPGYRTFDSGCNRNTDACPGTVVMLG